MSTRFIPCPCECNSGGFCGGCGHAGCSGGINVPIRDTWPTISDDDRDWDTVAVVGLVHPEVCVRLTGTDGNAFAIMASVTRALRAAGVDDDEIHEFTNDSMSGDYDNLLQTAMRWVTVS